MSSKFLRRAAWFAALGTVAILGSTAAQAQQAQLPPVQQRDGIAYMSGGDDADSARAIQDESRHWPATLEFAVQAKPVDAYTANVQVQIRDAQQHVVLDAVSDGPFLLARLQPGRYDVKATFAGKTLDRALQVRANAPARQVFVWPHSAMNAQG